MWVCASLECEGFTKFLGYRYKLIYIIFLLHGMAILLPWNIFMNAEKVFITQLIEIN